MDDGGQEVRDRRIRLSQGIVKRLHQLIDLAQRSGSIDGGSRDPGAEVFFLSRGEAGTGYP
jgi:hypothetical protein